MIRDQLYAGVDEAGRGSVLGPLVACCYTGDVSITGLLAEMGVVDSKRLSSGRREELFPRVVGAAEDVRWTFLSPCRIDRENLNTLYTREVVSMIRMSPAGKIVLDAPVGPGGLERYGKYVASLCPGRKIEARNHAEEFSRFVAAASICAKVIRDRVIQTLSERLGPIGSGYPSDPVTRDWLKRHYDAGVAGGIVRRKWNVSCH